jgi:hypothetical protein
MAEAATLDVKDPDCPLTEASWFSKLLFNL